MELRTRPRRLVDAATRVLRSTGDVGPYAEVAGGSNFVLMSRRFVVRANTAEGGDRLATEARLVAAMPKGVGPRCLNVTVHGGVTVGLYERLPGRALLDWSPDGRPAGPWLTMSASHRQAVAEQMVERLSLLHGWRPPADDRLTKELDRRSGSSAVFRSPTALLADGARLLDRLNGDARSASVVSPKRIAAVLERVEALVPMWRPLPTVLVHSDCHLGNVLVDGSDLTALIDFEWAHWSSPDAELHRLLEDAGQGAPSVITAVRNTAPAWLEAPHLEERLALRTAHDLIHRSSLVLAQPSLSRGHDHAIGEFLEL